MSAKFPFRRSTPANPKVLHCFLFAVLLLLTKGSSGGFATTQEGNSSDLGLDYHLPGNPGELLRIDREMRAFFLARINPKASLPTKLDDIANAILGEEGLHYRYEATGIYDVREAFRRRRGNCLTYSMLTVAVAREFGIPARFNEVLIDPKWNRTGGIVLRCGHINVRIDQWPESYELDLEMNEALLASRRSSRVVNDVRAYAEVYSSAGVHRLAAGDLAEALLLLEKATTIDPNAVSAWNNFGGALLKAGQIDRAQVCYEQALASEPNGLAALSGMAAIHRAKGETVEAKKLEGAVTRYLERNPYYLLSVARGEISRGNLEEARRHLKRAIGIKKDEPEFYQLMAEVTFELGLESEAKRWNKLSQRDQS